MEERQILRALLAFDANGRSARLALDELIDSDEIAAAEGLLESRIAAGDLTVDARAAMERRLQAARSETERDFAQRSQIQIERVRTLGEDIPPNVFQAAEAVIQAARRSAKLANQELG